MAIDFVQIDAFTSEAFRGNPAAVCVLDAPADDAWMQLVAREMNLSETAFLHPEADGWRLRWFTPTAEVDLCGHATLATVHTLVTDHGVTQSALRFHTRSGLLTAEAEADGRIILDFPSGPAVKTNPPAGLVEALGAVPVEVARGTTDYLVELDCDATVRKLAPNITALEKVEARGVIVTARNDRDGFDMVSRFFAPRFGVPEDPVTGSAHTTLAPWWAAKLGIHVLRAEQASARGGELELELRGDRVRLAGHAVTTVRGQILV